MMLAARCGCGASTSTRSATTTRPTLRLPPVVPVTDADWADMAKQGFNVVRLLVSWSSLEPARGTFDDAYIGRVHDAVEAAAAHGIYSVIDMHQDAWGKFIATPPGVTCAAGSEPAIGWDGAPQWATLTDGADTCHATDHARALRQS